MSDVDAIWLRDPLPELARYRSADVVALRGIGNWHTMNAQEARRRRSSASATLEFGGTRLRQTRQVRPLNLTAGGIGNDVLDMHSPANPPQPEKKIERFENTSELQFHFSLHFRTPVSYFHFHFTFIIQFPFFPTPVSYSHTPVYFSCTPVFSIPTNSTPRQTIHNCNALQSQKNIIFPVLLFFQSLYNAWQSLFIFPSLKKQKRRDICYA